jgi:P4 family phage/plasmid primase-like protien
MAAMTDFRRTLQARGLLDSRGMATDWLKSLREDSAITDKHIVAREYRVITDRAELVAAGWTPNLIQSPAGLLIPTWLPDGTKGIPQFRPEKEWLDRKSGDAKKYLRPSRQATKEGPDGPVRNDERGFNLDVPPLATARVADVERPLWVTEGEKKGDAIASTGRAVVALSGVDCWDVPDQWAMIPLDGRRVNIVFDSDVMRKDEVQRALKVLTSFLKTQGARVYWVYLEDLDGGKKCGIDDYLAAGYSMADLVKVKAGTPPPAEETEEWPAFSLDDEGNADRLVHRYADRLRWLEDNQTWAVYDHTGGVWLVRGVNNRAQGLLRHVFEGMEAGEAPQHRQDSAKWKAFVARCRNSAAKKTALECAKDRRALHAGLNDFDQNPDLLNVKNGVLDTVSFELLPHSPDYLFTKRMVTAYVPGAQCDLWDAYLETFLPDPEVRALAQVVMGYSLLAENPGRYFVMAVGPTSSGKGTLQAMFAQGILGVGDTGYATVGSLALMRGSFEEKASAQTVEAMRAHVLFFNETSHEWELHVDHIKGMTGNDVIKARRPHDKASQVGVPCFTPILFTNDPPQIKGADRAMDRRLVLIPFDNSVADKGEDQAMKKELVGNPTAREAALAWAVEGLKVYRRKRAIVMPQSVVRRLPEVTRGFNPLNEFLFQCTREGEWAATDDLYAGYEEWHFGQNMAARTLMDKTEFGRALSYVHKREGAGRRRWGYLGLVRVGRRGKRG